MRYWCFFKMLWSIHIKLVNLNTLSATSEFPFSNIILFGNKKIKCDNPGQTIRDTPAHSGTKTEKTLKYENMIFLKWLIFSGGQWTNVPYCENRCSQFISICKKNASKVGPSCTHWKRTYKFCKKNVHNFSDFMRTHVNSGFVYFEYL